MGILFIILSVAFVLCCFAMVGAILLQKKRSAGGMGSIAGMGSVTESYWDRNKGRSAEGMLELGTKIGAVVIGVLSVILCII